MNRNRTGAEGNWELAAGRESSGTGRFNSLKSLIKAAVGNEAGRALEELR